MKIYISAGERSVTSPIDRLKSMLGIGWYTKATLNKVDYGKCNFMISPDYYGDSADTWVDKVKKVGGKYVTKRYGDVYFYYDMSALNSAYEAEKQQAKDDYTAELNAMDIDQYKPDQATIKKITDYRDRGSKVNVKAIKDINKALRYYYTGKLIGWDDLCGDIWDKLHWDYADLMTAIGRRVAQDNQYADTRADYEKSNDLPSTNGLFTFEDKHCWLPKSVLMFFVNNNIPVHFEKRTRKDGASLDRNGRDWTEVEHLTLFPDSDNPISCNIAVTTDEGGGSSCFSGDIDDRRLCDYYSSAKKLLAGLEDWYAHYQG